MRLNKEQRFSPFQDIDELPVEKGRARQTREPNSVNCQQSFALGLGQLARVYKAVHQRVTLAQNVVDRLHMLETPFVVDMLSAMSIVSLESPSSAITLHAADARFIVRDITLSGGL